MQCATTLMRDALIFEQSYNTEIFKTSIGFWMARNPWRTLLSQKLCTPPPQPPIRQAAPLSMLNPPPPPRTLTLSQCIMWSTLSKIRWTPLLLPRVVIAIKRSSPCGLWTVPWCLMWSDLLKAQCRQRPPYTICHPTLRKYMHTIDARITKHKLHVPTAHLHTPSIPTERLESRNISYATMKDETHQTKILQQQKGQPT